MTCRKVASKDDLKCSALFSCFCRLKWLKNFIFKYLHGVISDLMKMYNFQVSRGQENWLREFLWQSFNVNLQPTNLRQSINNSDKWGLFLMIILCIVWIPLNVPSISPSFRRFSFCLPFVSYQSWVNCIWFMLWHLLLPLAYLEIIRSFSLNH